MKGLKHNVIEISDTHNENIDKILVFLKPEAANVAVMTTRAQAAEMIKQLDIKQPKRLWTKKRIYAAATAAVIIALIAIFVL